MFMEYRLECTFDTKRYLGDEFEYSDSESDSDEEEKDEDSEAEKEEKVQSIRKPAMSSQQIMSAFENYMKACEINKQKKQN